MVELLAAWLCVTELVNGAVTAGGIVTGFWFNDWEVANSKSSSSDWSIAWLGDCTTTLGIATTVADEVAAKLYDAKFLEARLNDPSRCYSPYKAPCGSSKHGLGIAIDVNTGGWKSQVPSTTSLTNVYVWMALNGWKYGFIRGVKTETWHFEYHPEKAKSGPYGIVGVDKNFQRTMEFKGKLFDLSKITVA